METVQKSEMGEAPREQDDTLHAGNRPGVPGVLARLVKKFYEAPQSLSYMEDNSTPLPVGVGDLLQDVVANIRLDGRIADAPVANDRDGRDHHDIHAVIFFVTRVLLADDASYYRILGLSQHASLRDVHHHYRMLRRLLLPYERSLKMREHINRISEAYLVLRDSRSRKEYDLGLLRGDQ